MRCSSLPNDLAGLSNYCRPASYIEMSIWSSTGRLLSDPCDRSAVGRWFAKAFIVVGGAKLVFAPPTSFMPFSRRSRLARVRENRQRRADRQGRRVIIRPPIERATKAARSLWSRCRHVRSSAPRCLPAARPARPRRQGARLEPAQPNVQTRDLWQRLPPPVCAHLGSRSICGGSGGHRTNTFDLGVIEIIRPPLHHRPSMSEIARRIIGGAHAARLMGKLVLDPVGLE